MPAADFDPAAVSAAGFQARVKLATFTSNDKTWRSEKRKDGPKRQSPAKDIPRCRRSGQRLPRWVCAPGQSRASGSPSRICRLFTFPTVLLGSSRAPRNGSSRRTMASPRGSKPSHTWVVPLRCLTLYLVSQTPTLPAHSSSEVKDCTSPRMLCTTEQDSVHCSSQAVQ